MFDKWRGWIWEQHFRHMNIYLYNKDGSFIKQFTTQTECSKSLWINQSLISQLLKLWIPKKIKNYFIWNKKNDNINHLLRNKKMPVNTKKIICKVNWQKKEYIWYKSLCKDIWISIASIVQKKRKWNKFTIKWIYIEIIKEEKIWQVIYK